MILSILSFSFISLASVILAISSPANGYELSIYQAYPWYFWFFIVGGVLCSILILFMYSIYDIKGNSWILGLLSLTLVYFTFLLLPIFRGYALYGRGGADVLTHIGHTKTIISTGYIYKENFYPIVHILQTCLKFIGISFEKAVVVIPSFFSMLYLLFILILAKTIGRNHHYAIFILALASPLLFSYFHMCVHPFMICLFLMPLLLYSFHKRKLMDNTAEFSLIIALLSILVVFFHPFMTLILIMIFLMFDFSEISYRYLVKPDKYDHFRSNVNIILIIILSFLAWYLSFHLIQNLFSKVIHQFQEPIATNYVKTLGSANISIIQTIGLIISKYGAILLYFMIALICTILVFKKFLRKKVDFTEYSYCAQFVLGIFLGMLFLLSYFVVSDPIRALIYAILASVLMTGLVSYAMIKNEKKGTRTKIAKKLTIFSVILIVLSASVICIFNVYSSPITSSANPQMSYMERNGVEFFLAHKESNTLAASFGFSFKIENYIFGIDKAESTRSVKIFSIHLPNRFGYLENETIAKSFGYNKTYVITTEFNRIAYKSLPENTWSKAHRYLKEDFERLSSDSTANKVYGNSEFESWLVHGK